MKLCDICDVIDDCVLYADSKIKDTVQMLCVLFKAISTVCDQLYFTQMRWHLSRLAKTTSLSCGICRNQRPKSMT